MIIDAHCHAGRGDILNAPWNTKAPLDAYLRRARAAGVQKTIVIPAGHSNYAEANAELARIVARNQNRLIGFASTHAQRDAGRIYEIVARAVREYGFRGLKIHGYDALPSREVCEAVRRLRIPLLVDVVGRAYIVELLASQYRRKYQDESTNVSIVSVSRRAFPLQRGHLVFTQSFAASSGERPSGAKSSISGSSTGRSSCGTGTTPHFSQ